MVTMDLNRTASVEHGARAALSFPWVSTLREHAAILAELDPELLSAISVTIYTDAYSPMEAAAIRRFSQELADELGLDAMVHFTGSSFSVRFMHRTGGPTSSPDSSPGGARV
jgi:hypothetical protein